MPQSDAPSVALGEWIKTPQISRGIWRVSRLLTGFYEPRWSLDDPKVRSTRVTVFSNRVVGNTWKRSFATQSCNVSLVEGLDEDERSKLDGLLAANPKLRSDFETYQANPKPVDMVMNLRFGSFKGRDLDAFKRSCNEHLRSRISGGLTLDAVLEFLQEKGFHRHQNQNPAQITLQLVSKDHEMQGDEFILREFSFLNF